MQLMLEVVGMGKKALGQAATYQFSPAGGVIGRGDDCDWVLPDPARRLSSRHALVTHRQGRYFITDISKNGVYLGINHRLPKNEPTAVADGSVFFFGALGIKASLMSPQPKIDAGPTAETTGPRPQNPTMALVAAQAKPAQEPSGQARTFPDRVKLSLGLRSAAGEPVNEQTTRLMSAVASGLNVPFQQLEKRQMEPLVYHLARAVRLFMRGMVDTWQSRTRLKCQLNQELTRVSDASNNPFKFAASEQQAIASLLAGAESEDFSLASAIQQCFADIEAHQSSAQEGVDQALRNLLYALSPEVIAANGNNKANRWFNWGGHNAGKAYGRQHRRLANDPDLAGTLATIEQRD